MKYIRLYAVLILFCFVGCGLTVKENTERDQVVADIVVKILKQYHYTPKKIDDSFSKQVFDEFIKQVDGGKRYFTATDIQNFKKYESQIDDFALVGDLTFPHTVFAVMKDRIKITQKWTDEILSEPFEFNEKRSVELDGDKRQFAATEKDLKNYWKEFLKFQVMQRYLDASEEKYTKDTDEEKYKKMRQFDPTVEKEARQSVTKNMKRYFDRLEKVVDEQKYDMYLNAITTVFDAHTTYYSPQDKKDFDVDMSGKIEGIGAVLKEDNGYVKIESIMPGGPAWKQKELKAEDAIIKVGQGDEEPIDITGFSVDEAVKLIRGKKGTTVKLTVKKPDGRIVVIPIVRDVVLLEETYAKSTVIVNEKTGKKYGYILLPKFYRDFDNNNSRNSTDDVRRELEELKKQKVDGVILDLRNNPGGALDDAVRVAGLFIKTGPVVQVRNGVNKIVELNDYDANVVYDGPLVVMVNGFSASASEIVAAAIQDYGRGVVVGTKSTFGKGTVQNIIDMDEIVGREYNPYKPLGSLTLTVQKFYRVSGESTQYKGVEPDIVFPDMFSYIPYGEKTLDYYLPWDTIRPAYYKKWSSTPINYSYLRERSKKRIAKSELFKLLDEQALRVKENTEKTEETLNLEQALTDLEKIRKSVNRMQELEKEMNYFKFPEIDKKEIPERQKKLEDWYTALKKDAYLDESMNILSDLIVSEQSLPRNK